MLFTEIIIEAAPSAVRKAAVPFVLLQLAYFDQNTNPNQKFLDFAALPTYHTSFFQAITLPDGGNLSAQPGDHLTCTIDHIPYPAIVEVNEPSEFTWRGYFGWNWIFNGLHSFRFEPLAAAASEEGAQERGQRTRLVHCEQLGGLLAGALALVGRQRMLAGFQRFNEDLKRYVEQQQ
ncbi:SRPBCC domain-containing protein [Aspergillus saccharolyticus JOP 1030-1]|uniref:Uncharacterized protein n=1 Tax=Aspergillus saccharolyticus JOP 1030-1 TaxID=1450539 RepID=A0A318Z5F7_9EURO|nr:hypothetical protein BP01DRAFT_385434 [Aspergillus saccharolyticus JOP 1030-1]PYH42551.1 hypothetical protein BP01DRAFT_385434 [Aspergillus saccharolyticus JOP 1030-1]